MKGTKGVPGFGELYVDQIRVGHVERWVVGIARLVQGRTYSPAIANGWLAIIKVIFKAAKRELSLATNPTEGIESFDTSEHPTYTEEEARPNRRTPHRGPKWCDEWCDGGGRVVRNRGKRSANSSESL